MDAARNSAWLARDNAPPVPITGNCSLGRAVGNGLVLIDDRVSRRHATIHAQDAEEFWLVDLGSRNGTYLNGRRVSQPTRLRGGDRIQIGPFALTFQLASPSILEASTARLPDPGEAEQTQVELRSEPCWLLVCDITGSTALARSHPAEELAVLVGGWFARCNEAIEDNGGSINKYLGDGLFAYWPGHERSRAYVAQSLRDLRRLQEERPPAFRIALHYGRVLFGGMPFSGEESLAGPEVNFVFRAEKLGGQLRLPRLASAPAARNLGDLMPHAPAGEHPLAGFEGTFPFFSF